MELHSYILKHAKGDFMTNVEFRSATEEELPEFYRQASRALGMTNDSLAGMNPDWTMCAFVDDKLVTTYGAWPLQIRFNGPATPMAGVTMVSTDPSHRRKGYLRSVKQRHFEQMHERGEQAIAALHPAWMAIYQRYGYGTINDRHSYTIEPRFINFHHPVEIMGKIREVNLEEEFGLLVDVYRRFREERNGLVHRGKAMWDEGPLEQTTPGRQRSVFTYEEYGEPLGYVIYTSGPGAEAQSSNGVTQYADVSDFFAMTPAAYQALWKLLAGIDNIQNIRWNNAPSNDPLVNMLSEPRMLNTSRRDGIMARLVTVQGALPQRKYDTQGEISFKLIDDFCPWNSGSWKLRTDESQAEVVAIQAGTEDLTLTPDTLATLMFGYYSATDAERAGLINVKKPEALAEWDRTLRTRYTPYEAEHNW
jgi:predicted acetyltransferase